MSNCFLQPMQSQLEQIEQDVISDVPKANQCSFIKHKLKPDFNPAKFTPTKIHNKIDLPIDDLVAFFLNNHPLSECAKRFGCSQATIKRKLRSVGVDTSIYNHTELAAKLSKLAVEVKLPSDEELRTLLVEKNFDTKTVAEMLGVHYNTIRKSARRLGIKKNRIDVARSMSSRHMRLHGCAHPAQRPDVLAKTRKSSSRIRYIDITGRSFLFRSLHELGYALLLDKRGVEWQYEEMRVPYIDMLTGKHHIYIIDFTVEYGDIVEWIEVKPNNKMIPEDKRIYASRRAEEAGVVYRGLADEERTELWKLLLDGYRSDSIEFQKIQPKHNATQISYWFHNLANAEQFEKAGWKRHSIISYSSNLYSLKMRRC